MSYVDYEYYKSLYGENALSESEFSRFLWEAEREIDKATSGVDGVRKLQIAFPTSDYDAESVRRCVVEVVSFLYKLEVAEKSLNAINEYTERADGSLQGKVVTSVSAGNESISYAVGKTSDTAISNAIKDLQSKDMTIQKLIASKLRGISDANGINLLFEGRYPYI